MALRATKGRARPDPVVLLLCRVWDRQSAVPPKCFRTSAFQRSWELGFLFPVTPLLPKATSFQKSAERGYGSAAETEALPGLPAHRAAGQGNGHFPCWHLSRCNRPQNLAGPSLMELQTLL